MPHFKTDEEARTYFASCGLTKSSTTSEILAAAPKLAAVAQDREHKGWKLKMIDGIPGFVL